MRILIIFMLLMVVASCKDKPDPKPVVVSELDVLISCEGNFGWGTGTLSVYDPVNETIQHEVYRAQNNEDIGNVFQSIARVNDHFYFTVNNGSKVIVTDSTYRKTDVIENLTSPRYLYEVSTNKAYITDLYANAISIIDLNTNGVVGTIDVNGWSERALIHNNEFWFTAPETDYVYIIDVASDAVVDSVKCSFNTESLIIDRQGMIWVLSKGDESSSIDGGLFKIDPTAREVKEEITLSGTPGNLVYSDAHDVMYFISNGVQRVQPATGAIDEFQPVQGRNIYSIGVDQRTGEVYISDIHDFVQQSTVYRYSADGALLNEFKAGVIAGNFFFNLN